MSVTPSTDRRLRAATARVVASLEPLEQRRLLASNPPFIDEIVAVVNTPSGTGFDRPLEGSFVEMNADAFDDVQASSELAYDWTVTLTRPDTGTTVIAQAQGVGASFLSFSPPDNGTAVVTLVVTDSDGNTATSSALRVTNPAGTSSLNRSDLLVINRTPFVTATPLIGAATYAEGSPIQGIGQVITDVPADLPLSYLWELANGPRPLALGDPYNVVRVVGTAPDVTFVEADEGQYFLVHSIADKDGAIRRLVSPYFDVVNAAPAPTVAGAPAAPITAGQPVTLTASPNDPGVNDTHTYLWTVTRDGQPVTLADPTTAAITFTADQAGSYAYSVVVTDNSGASGTSAPASFVADPAPVLDTATLVYSGQQHVTVGTNGIAALNLRATLTDLGADAADIESADVTFTVAHPTYGVVHTATVPVVGVDGDDSVGTAVSAFSYSTIEYPMLADPTALTVNVSVSGGYAAEPLSVPLTVSQIETGRILGSGSILLNGSGGLMGGQDGTRSYFAFAARRLTSGAMSGTVSLIYRGEDSRLYLVASTQVNSLYTWADGALRRAAMNADVNVYDITNPFNPSQVQSGLSLEVTMADGGNGQFDRIGFSVWNNQTGQLLFASKLDDDNDVADQLLDGGNLTVWNV